jgi:hypothetical protein
MPDVTQNIIAAMHVLYKHRLVRTFDDIFKYIPPTAVAGILDMGNLRFKKKKAAPDTFTELEVKKLASAFGMKEGQVKKMLAVKGK